MKTDVIIVGAGPTGLALAVQLTRLGVDFLMFDKNEAITPFSKAIGVQARTLEIYEQFGLAENLIALGAKAEKVKLVEGGAVRGTIELENLGANLTAYPFMLIVEQSKHEKLLEDFLRSNGKSVVRQTEIENFSHDANGVTATIKKANGERDVIGAKFLIGCDGAKSFVRHQLGLEFAGSTFERLFYVADVRIDWNFAHDSLYVCLAKNSITAFFPLSGANRFRIVGTFPENYAQTDENSILYEEIERKIKEDTQLELDIHDVNWFSVYKVHSRRVAKFSRGRCFLAGDAAHVHTPAGGQGMNTGIQDGYNLAWKIAAVLRGRADEKLLETYNEERLANADHLLKTTDRMFNFGANPDAVISYVRTHILPHIANFALHLEPVKNFIFPLVSQIGINYRQSSISFTDGFFKIKAGDRMPYFEFDGADVYDRLREPKFHLLMFFDGAHKTENYRENLPPEMFDFHEIPLYPPIAEIFGARETFTVLLRPDNYIGLLTAENSIGRITNYLNNQLHFNLEN